MTEAEKHEAVRQMLEAHNTMTIATCRDGQPWAATVFFASDKALNLYFVSDYRTRHARDVDQGADAAAAINADCARWSEVRGLQLAGTVGIVDGLDRINALRRYLMKFADVKALFEAPKGPDEETIAQRLRAANMYRFEPRWIRLIDNRQWFGYKREFACEGGRLTPVEP